MPRAFSERARAVGIKLLFFALVLLSLRLLFPFYLAFITVALISLLAERLKAYSRLSLKTLRLLLLGALLALAIGITYAAVRAVIRESEGFFTSLYHAVSIAIQTALRFVDKLKSRFHLGEIVTGEQLSSSLTELLTSLTASLSAKLATFAALVIKALPQAFIAAVAYLLATVYIALDYEKIKERLRALIPNSVRPTVSRLKRASLSLLKHTLRAYGILFLITFATVTVAFFFLKIDYPVWWALLTAGLDALPAIGIGIVLIPWSIGLFMTERTLQGILMLLLYLGITLLRQALEPRILGKELGVPPLVSLVALYLGFKLFGGWGLLLSPVLAVVITRFFFQKQDLTP